MIPVHAAGATDVGQVRQNNQDSFHIGDSVFAVADGMGGHLAGEVASEEALEPVRELDGRVFPDGETAVHALEDAVIEANRLVSTKAASDASYRGMGTTLTVAMFEGQRLHLAHVGDSRAYLLRDGEITQITTDHTLVQHLIDEGQITVEEAATHPQRSIVTRAIGVSRDVQVDAMTLEISEGDELLLCSDGLSGLVSDDVIAAVLREGAPARQTVDMLIAKANAAGGSDNITAVLLRFGEDHAEAERAAAAGRDGEVPDDGDGTRDGDGAKAPVVVRTGNGDREGDWADRLGRFGALGRAGDPDHTPGAARPRRWPAIVAAVVLVLVLTAAAGRWLLSRSYYVGVDEQQVVIYQGVPVSVGPLELSWVVERSGLTLDDVPSYYAQALREGVPALDLRDAQLIVRSAPRADEDEPGTEPDGTETPDADDGASETP